MVTLILLYIHSVLTIARRSPATEDCSLDLQNYKIALMIPLLIDHALYAAISSMTDQ
jgi:hypothetical protein